MIDAQQRGGGSETPESTPQATSNQNRFLNKIVVNLAPKSRVGWAVVIIVLAFLIIAWYKDFLTFRTTLLPYGVTIIGVITVLAIIGFILYGWFTCKNDIAKFFIATALFIWLIDLIPNGSLTWSFLSWLGPSYAGFDFPLSLGVWKLSLLSIILSSTFFAVLYVQMVFNIIKREWEVFLSLFGFILIANYILTVFYPNSANLNFIVPGGPIAYVVLVLVVIGLGVYVWWHDKKHRGTAFGELWSSVYLALGYSFFLINNGWQGNLRAIIHALYIIAFGYIYIKSKENDNPVAWRVYIITLLFIDFFGYGLLWNSGLLVLRFIPPVVLFTIFYCYHKETEQGTENYNYPVAAMILLVTFILIMSVDKVAGFEGGGLPFVAKKGTDYKDLYGQFTDRLRGFVEDRLDIATAGLYRGAVERNRYESLGVYFANIRAADPRFYTSEPITVWGAIRSKTYQDAVVINFSCYRVKDNKRIGADKIIPEVVFPIFTLEEVDTECVFNPKTNEKDKIQAGPNTITLSAEYNFGTDAYIKTYFMDRERLRAYARNNIEPLTELGIKDKNPIAVFTNGPVEIGLSTGQPLVTISEGSVIKPSIGITLTNRQEIQDKDKRIITRWEGKIKNITELVLLTPPGIELPDIKSCNLPKESPNYDIEKLKCPCSMPFVSYSEDDCKKTCKEQVQDQCKKACKESLKDSNEQTNCITDCDTNNENCEKECGFLFNPQGEGIAGKYTGYALDVGSLQFKDLNKDIDKHRSFQCRFEADKGKLLDKSPITTRYFRVRARYNYLLENSVIVNVEESPKEAIDKVPDLLYKTALEFRPGSSFWFEGFNGLSADLISAIASVESGYRHCCQEVQAKGTRCTPTKETSCDFERLLTSGTSYGIMQINYKGNNKALVDGLAQSYCNGKSINDYECNVKIGAILLKKKYDSYKDGCKQSSEYKQYDNIKNACDNGKTSEKYGSIPYESYRNELAAVRGYNGWGYDSRYDKDYVEKVKEALKKIQDGVIKDNSIRDLFSSRGGDGMVDDTTTQQGTTASSENIYLADFQPREVNSGQDVTYTFTGRGFQPGAVLIYKGTPMEVTYELKFIDSTQLELKKIEDAPAANYLIQIKNPDGKLSNSLTLKVTDATTQQNKPLPPTNPDAAYFRGQFINSISISWVASNTQGISGYRIYKYYTSGGYIKSYETTNTDFKDTEIIDGTEYIYAIAALKDGFESDSAWTKSVKAGDV